MWKAFLNTFFIKRCKYFVLKIANLLWINFLTTFCDCSKVFVQFQSESEALNFATASFLDSGEVFPFWTDQPWHTQNACFCVNAGTCGLVWKKVHIFCCLWVPNFDGLLWAVNPFRKVSCRAWRVSEAHRQVRGPLRLWMSAASRVNVVSSEGRWMLDGTWRVWRRRFPDGGTG